MATKTKTTKSNKKRLALPPNFLKNLDEVRKNVKQVQSRGLKEVEKIYGKVVEIDFVKKVRKHEVYKKASKAGTKIQKDAKQRIQKLSKEVEQQVSNIRTFIPVPTRSEVETLTKKVEALSKKVNSLSNSKKVAVG